MVVSIFHNFNEVTENLPLASILEFIHDGRFKSQIESLRTLLSEGDKKEYDRQKKSLPAFTPSATFKGGRRMEFLTQYTGYIILDIDKIPTEKLPSLKSVAASISYTYACFNSPSNCGLKILVKTDSKIQFHKIAFEQVKEYYEMILNQSIDPSGKDISRLCFLSYDEYLYFNEDSDTFEIIAVMIENDILKVVEQIESLNIDITNGYKNWLNIGFALADALGENGRVFFHRVSLFSSKYEVGTCNEQFDKCLKSTGSGITAKSFFFIAKDHGIDIASVKSYDISDFRPTSSPVTSEIKTKKNKRNNLVELMEQYISMNYALRYNIVSGRLEVRKRYQVGYEQMTDYIENSILRELLKNDLQCNSTKLRNILLSDYCKTFDPFKEYFDHLPPWDGESDFILQLSKTISTTDDQFWQLCFKKWIVASVASLLVQKIVNHTAIIFSGPQGIGKTTWMENLCPTELRSYLFSGTINLTNKDTLIHLTECWFINMDELENMNRTEIGTLKEVITKSAIRTRRAYGHNSETLPRRASFMGSVNTSQFLNDSTGSRRFLCFEVLSIDYQHQVEIDKVYSQALALFHQGFRFYFDKNEISEITANNEQYQVKTIEEELLLTWFRKPETNETPLYLPTSQILLKLTIYSKISTTTGNAITLGKALKKHNFQRVKKKGNYVYSVIELTLDQVERENRIAPEQESDHPQSSDKQDDDDTDDLPF